MSGLFLYQIWQVTFFSCICPVCKYSQECIAAAGTVLVSASQSPCRNIGYSTQGYSVSLWEANYMQSEGSSFSTVADGNRDLLLMWHTCASFLGGPPGPGCRQWKVRSNLFRCWIITQDCRSEWLCSVQSDARLLSTPVRSRRGFSEHVYMHVCVKSVPTWLSVAVQKDGGASWHLCVQFCVNGADKVVWRCFHSNGGKAGLTGTIVNLLWQTSLLLCENLQLKEHRKTDSHQNLFSVHFFFSEVSSNPKTVWPPWMRTHLFLWTCSSSSCHCYLKKMIWNGA